MLRIFFRHDALTLFPREREEFQDRAVVNFRHAFHARNGVPSSSIRRIISAFARGRYMPSSALSRRFGEHLAALLALATLASSALTELAAVDPAIVTSHREISC
jgi:hypothetical protein